MALKVHYQRVYVFKDGTRRNNYSYHEYFENEQERAAFEKQKADNNDCYEVISIEQLPRKPNFMYWRYVPVKIGTLFIQTDRLKSGDVQREYCIISEDYRSRSTNDGEYVYTTVVVLDLNDMKIKLTTVEAEETVDLVQTDFNWSAKYGS